MGAFIDEVGNHYGKLTVIRGVGIDRHKCRSFECLCDCGKTKIVSGNDLRRGHVKSCGCLHKRPYGETAFKHMFKSMKKSAKKRGYIWDLTEEQVAKITKQNCFYCGVEPSNNISNLSYNGDYVYSGIDRINNKIGYIIDNVISCCRVCNHAKCIMTIEEFFKWMERVMANKKKCIADIAKVVTGETI